MAAKEAPSSGPPVHETQPLPSEVHNGSKENVINNAQDSIQSSEQSSNKERRSEEDAPEHGAHDPAAEARLRRKLDRHLVPLLFALYLLAFLDRGNIGNAKIAGMAKDLELTGFRYNWLLTIFYVSYILFNWLLLFWKRFPPHIVATVIVCSWGLMSTLLAAAQTWSGAMALRFFLGLTEAGLAPGIVYLFTFFYLKDEIGLRVGLFVSSAPLASTFSGALAYGITSGHSKLAPWRLLFLVEGLATMLMIPITYMFLPDSPDKARFLNEEERAIAKSRAIRQAGTTERTGRGGFQVKEMLSAGRQVQVWVIAVMYFGANVSYASLPVFLPTILKDMGYSGINAQGLSAPPSFAAFLAAIGMAWMADRTQQRGLAVFASGVVAGIGYVLLVTVDIVGVKYFATFLAAAGVFSTIPNIDAWILNNSGSDSRRGTALIILNLVGQCGPILGTAIYPTAQEPKYVEGNSICAAFMFFSALLALALRFLLQHENKKLDEKYGKLEEIGSEVDNTATESRESPRFRYVL